MLLQSRRAPHEAWQPGEGAEDHAAAASSTHAIIVAFSVNYSSHGVVPEPPLGKPHHPVLGLATYALPVGVHVPHPMSQILSFQVPKHLLFELKAVQTP